MKLLYVEDNPLDMDLTCRELNKLEPQYHVETATSFQEAIRKLDESSEWDVILTDLRLPDGSGLELLTHIRRKQLPAALVVMTGTGDWESAVTALKAGADDYILKRSDYLARLPVIIENAFHQHQAEVAQKSRRLSVLYAERNASDRDLTRLHLAEHAAYIDLDVVQSAPEVLHLFKARKEERVIPWDILLFDYNLPGMNGLELAKELREVYDVHLPLVLVTGHGNEEIAVQALRLGVSNYLVKSPGYLYRLPGVLENVHYLFLLERERESLRRSEARYRALVEQMPAIIYATAEKVTGGVTYISPQISKLGYTPAEWLADPDSFVKSLHPEDVERVLNGIAYDHAHQNEVQMLEYRLVGKNGQTFWFRDEAIIIRDEAGNIVCQQGLMLDITEKKLAEEKAARLGRLYAVLAHVDEAITRYHVIEELFEKVCQIMVNEGGIGFSWIGVVDTKINEINPVAMDGTKEHSLDVVERLLNGEVEQQPVRLSVTSGQHQVWNDLEGENATQPWFNTAIELGYRSLATFPIKSGERVSGVISLYAGEAYFFDRDEIIHFITLAEDLAYAVGSLEQEAARQQAEIAVRLSEEKHRTLFETMTQGVVYQDSNNFIFSANRAAEEILGLTLEQMQGRTSFDPRWQSIHEDGSDFLGDEHPSVVALQTGKPVRGVMGVFNPRDEKYRWINIHAVPQFLEGEAMPFQVYATFEDITGKKQAEERLQLQSAALESAASPIVITDREGTLEWVNPAFCQLTGYSWEDVVGKNSRLLKSGKHSREFYEEMWHTILSGAVWRGELTNRRKNGQNYFEQETITPVKNSAGEVTHFISIKEDITDQKKHVSELETSAELSQALRAGLPRRETLEKILSHMMQMVEADGAWLVVHDIVSGEGVMEVSVGSLAYIEGIRFPPGAGVHGAVAETKKPYRSLDPESDPLLDRPDLFVGIKSLICVPMIAQGNLIGTVMAVSKKYLTEMDEHLLDVTADTAASVIQRSVLQEQTERRLKQLTTLRAVDETISGTLDLKLLLKNLLEHITAELKVDAAGVLLVNRFTNLVEPAAGRGFRTDHYLSLPIRLGQGIAGKAVLERVNIAVSDLDQMHTEFVRSNLMREEGFSSYYGFPLTSKGKTQGMLEIFNREKLQPDRDWLDFSQILAGQVAIALENALLFDDLQRSNLELSLAYDDTIEGWSQALDLRDKETEGHTQRVTDLALSLASIMGIRGEDLVYLRRGALLHDMGKMGVPDNILLKPGALDDEEWVIMRLHPVYAYQMLSRIAYLRYALDVPYCHHEKWDGSGYPRGLKEQEIPLSARIFAIVDVWDALTSNRPYRKAWSKEKALKHIQAQSGKHFDPMVVDIFLKHISVWTTE